MYDDDSISASESSPIVPEAGGVKLPPVTGKQFAVLPQRLCRNRTFHLVQCTPATCANII